MFCRKLDWIQSHPPLLTFAKRMEMHRFFKRESDCALLHLFLSVSIEQLWIIPKFIKTDPSPTDCFFLFPIRIDLAHTSKVSRVLNINSRVPKARFVPGEPFFYLLSFATDAIPIQFPSNSIQLHPPHFFFYDWEEYAPFLIPWMCLKSMWHLSQEGRSVAGWLKSSFPS